MTKAQKERKRMRRLRKIVRGTMKFFGLSYECPMEYRKNFVTIALEIMLKIAFVAFVLCMFVVMLLIWG